MLVQLWNFRCYETFSVEIPENQIVRFEGDNGAGKSTIFEAFEFALYGGLQEVYPDGKSGSNTMVILKFDDGLVVARSRNPNQFRVVYQEREWSEKAAEGIIQRLFGDKEVWKATSYVEQETRCFLFSENNEVKKRILTSLSDSENVVKYMKDNDEDIKRTETERTQYFGRYTQSQYELKLKYQEYVRFLYEKGLYNPTVHGQNIPGLDKEVSEADRLSLSEQVKRLKVQLTVLNQDLIHYSQAVSSKQTLEREVQTLTQNLASLKYEDLTKDEAELTELRKSRSLIESSLKQAESMEKIEKDMQQLRVSVNSNLRHVSQSELDLLTRAHHLYNQDQQIAKSLGIELDREVVRVEIERINKELKEASDSSSMQPIYDQFVRLKTQFATLIQSEPVEEGLIEKETEKLNSMRRSQDVQKCPCCSVNLRVLNGKIVPADSEPISQNEINTQAALLSDLQRRDQAVKYRAKLETELNLLQVRVGDWKPKSFNLLDLNRRLSELRKIIFAEKPEADLQEVQRCFQNSGLSLKLASLEKGYIKPEKDSSSLRTEIQQLDFKIRSLETKVNNQRGQNATFLAVQEQKKRAEAQIANLTIPQDPSDKIKELNNELSTLSCEEERQTKVSEVFRLNKIKLELEAIINQLDRDKTDWLVIRQALVQAELKMLTKILEQVNRVVDDIIPYFFPGEDIDIKIIMESKGGVGVEIKRGSIVKKFKRLSGGEKDKVALVIFIAFCRLGPGKVVMLDESFSFVDMKMREVVVSCIREKVVSKKSVMIVSHGDIGGFYDHVIELSKSARNSVKR